MLLISESMLCINKKKSLPLSSKSLNILPTNVNEKLKNNRYYVRPTKNASSTPQPATVHNGLVLTESDTLPWPMLNSAVTPEFKWKAIRPTNIPHHRNHIGLEQTFEMNDKNLMQETPSNVNGTIEMPTHIYPSFSLSEQSQSYHHHHPYEFENIHSLSNFNTSPAINLSDNIYAQPIDHPNESTVSENEHRTKDGAAHIEHINHE